jgi:cell division protein FtsX
LGLAIVALLVAAGTALVVIPDEGSHETPVVGAGAVTATTTTAAVPASAPAPTTAATTVPTTGRYGQVIDPREVVIFMQPIATPSEVDAVRRTLQRMTDVLSIRFVDKAEALAEIRALFADQPQVVGSIDVEDAPVNFHVLPRPSVDRHVIGARVDKHKNVLSVVYPGE